jgi:hypothetical protein
MGTGGRNQVAHGPDTAVRRPEGEPELVGKGHCEEFTENSVRRRSKRISRIYLIEGLSGVEAEWLEEFFIQKNVIRVDLRNPRQICIMAF